MSKISPKTNKVIFTDEVLSVLPANNNIKRSAANVEKNTNPIIREKMASKIRGQKRTEESKKRMSEIQKEICKDRVPEHLFDPAIHEKAIAKQRGIPRPQTSQKLKGRKSKLIGKKRPELSKKLNKLTECSIRTTANIKHAIKHTP